MGNAFAAMGRGEVEGAAPTAGFRAHAKEIADAVEVWGLTWPQIHAVLVRERLVSPSVPADRLRKWWHEGVRKGWAKRVSRGSRAKERPVPVDAEPMPAVPERAVVPEVQDPPRAEPVAMEEPVAEPPRKGRIGRVM